MEGNMESGLTITACSTQSGKRRKNKATCEEEEEEDDNDLFYKLTESLITHIISFLPTKDAIRTCVLSKPWKHRWTSLTKLCLHDDHDRHDSSPSPKLQNFISFVTRALLLTRTLTMETISLSLSGQYDPSLLEAWFCIMLLDRTLKNLRIHSHFELPFSAFASNSLFKNIVLLEELELQAESISLIKVPSKPDIHFGNLKHLKLCSINFNTNSPTSRNHIDLRFPHLINFEAKNCSWFLDSRTVFVHAPLLQSILIDNGMHMLYGEDNSAINFVSSLDLQVFYYRGNYIPQGILTPSPCCAYAKIIIRKGPAYVPDHSIFGLLSQFSHAKRIRFEVSEGDLAPPPQLCIFSMLTKLEAFFVSFDVLLALLQKSPALQTLVLKAIYGYTEERLNSAVVPKCFASLYAVTFIDVDGDESDLILAKFFMENCMMLQRMHINKDSQSQAEVMEEFLKKLHLFGSLNFVFVKVYTRGI